MLSAAQIVEIRDNHLPSQGERFDCIAFARAIEAAVYAETTREMAAAHTLWSNDRATLEDEKHQLHERIVSLEEELSVLRVAR